MKFPIIPLAASFVVASAAFTSSFAGTGGVGHSFDWIFFAIVGIPFIIGFASLFRPDILERYIRPWPWEENRVHADEHQPQIVEQPDHTLTP